jgi:hypothetical protein
MDAEIRKRDGHGRHGRATRGGAMGAQAKLIAAARPNHGGG